VLVGKKHSNDRESRDNPEADCFEAPNAVQVVGDDFTVDLIARKVKRSQEPIPLGHDPRSTNRIADPKRTNEKAKRQNESQHPSHAHTRIVSMY
jgi:hypothetical protein